MTTQKLVNKIVKFNSILSSLPIKGKVGYPCKWENGTPVTYLIYRPGFGGKWVSPEEVKVEDIVDVVG